MYTITWGLCVLYEQARRMFDDLLPHPSISAAKNYQQLLSAANIREIMNTSVRHEGANAWVFLSK